MPRARFFSLLLLVVSLGVLISPRPAAADLEPMTLRVEDATVVPGGVLAVVIRTYSPRGVGQGQVCLGRPAGFAGPSSGPLVELIEARVFSDTGDAVVSADFDAASQELMVDFSSASASINRTDGPMMALLFRVDDQLSPGSTFMIEVDPSMSALTDADGASIAIEPRAGEMTVRSPAAPYGLDAEGADAAAGEWAEAGVGSEESLPLSSGTVVFLYDPAVVSGAPEVTMSPRFGHSTSSVVLGPGRVEVTFTSPDASLNRVPGQFVTVRLPMAPDIGTSGTSLVSLESGTTELFDADGLPVTLVLDDDVLDFVPLSETAMFYDGFENGALTGWCVAVP